MDQYNPGDHKVDEVKTYVEEHPEQAEAILEAEKEGDNRVTLVESLQKTVDAQLNPVEPAAVEVAPAPAPTVTVNAKEYTVDADRGYRETSKKDYTQKTR